MKGKPVAVRSLPPPSQKKRPIGDTLSNITLANCFRVSAVCGKPCAVY